MCCDTMMCIVNKLLKFQFSGVWEFSRKIPKILIVGVQAKPMAMEGDGQEVVIFHETKCNQQMRATARV